ncbi:MAG: divalent-cation tolerance protein CutA [Nanoarchaeota archaeon]|nr:divalent-cation tolerance protein CutA [Nanoarchaeota archaeon]
MEAIMVYITCKDEKEAKAIATELLGKKLIACANCSAHKSFYTWKGKLNEDKEVALLAKTRKELFHKVTEEVRRLHSFELPCILSWEVQGDNDYLKWVEEETQ